MTMLVVGLALAVLASVALNASYLMQHAGSVDAPTIDAHRPLATMAALLRSRWWTIGAALGLLGALLHAAALYGAPLSLVEVFAIGGLALTVPASARVFGQRLGRDERVAVGAIVVGLAVLAVGNSASVVAQVPTVGLAVGVVLAAAAAGLLAMVPSRGRRRGITLAAAGGVLYGAGDAATKALAVVAHGGLLGVLVSPWLAVFLALSVAAFACFQRGLQLGPVVPVIVIMTAATNATAILAGLLVFGDPLGGTPILAALHLAAFGVAGLAGLRLVGTEAQLAPGPALDHGGGQGPEDERQSVLGAGEPLAARHDGQQRAHREQDRQGSSPASADPDGARQRADRTGPHTRDAVVGHVDQAVHVAG